MYWALTMYITVIVNYEILRCFNLALKKRSIEFTNVFMCGYLKRPVFRLFGITIN